MTTIFMQFKLRIIFPFFFFFLLNKEVQLNNSILSLANDACLLRINGFGIELS